MPIHSYEPDDLLRHERITDVCVRPDAEAVTAVVKTIDAASDSYRSTLWSFPLDDAGGAPQPLSAGTGLDTQPRWSPDGKRLVFTSDRAGPEPQLFSLPADGGEARPLPCFEGGVVDFGWRPDGRALWVVASVQVDPADTGARTRGSQAGGNGGPEVVWRLPYKLDGSGYSLGSEKHLFTLRLDGEEGDDACRRLTDGRFDVRSASWSPDGQRLAFARTRDGEDEAHCTDIWCCAADGSQARRLTQDQPTAMSPRWSPDGRWIAFAGNVDAGDGQQRLWLIDMQAPKGGVRPLGDEDLEVLGSSVAWHDGEVWVIRAHRGRQSVVRLSVPDGRLHEVAGGDRQVAQFAVTPRHAVVSTEDGASVGALCAVARDGRDTGNGRAPAERRIDRFNRWTDARTPLQVEARSFDVPDGQGGRETVHGWLVRSRDADGAQPLLVDVHGGPASYALLAYGSHAYWPVLCSRGWAVLALNPVGSSSFGRPFASRLRGCWGELDLPQHQAAAAALRDEGIADAERWAITGKSYGGYLAAWAIGQTQDFRAAVVSAPVTNLETHYGTSDSGYYADPYSMRGQPYIDRETSQRLSPMKHVDKAVTPTLLLQGMDDERCPKCQSEEFYVTLERGSRAVCEMVLYPGGSHHMFEDGKPSHRVDAVTRLTEWLGRFIDTPLEQAQEPPPDH